MAIHSEISYKKSECISILKCVSYVKTCIQDAVITDCYISHFYFQAYNKNLINI